MTGQQAGMSATVQTLVTDLQVIYGARRYHSTGKMLSITTTTTTAMQTACLQLLTLGGAQRLFAALTDKLTLPTAARFLHLHLAGGTGRTMTGKIAGMTTRKRFVAGLVTGRSGLCAGDIETYIGVPRDGIPFLPQ